MENGRKALKEQGKGDKIIDVEFRDLGKRGERRGMEGRGRKEPKPKMMSLIMIIIKTPTHHPHTHKKNNRKGPYWSC